MSFTYEWNVKSLKTKTEGANADSVIQVYWSVTGKDANNVTGTFDGATPFSSVGQENFVPYEDLTEEIVIGWIQEEVNARFGYMDHIDRTIQRKIDEKVNPQVEQDLPWNV
jgi:hypothetical protein